MGAIVAACALSTAACGPADPHAAGSPAEAPVAVSVASVRADDMPATFEAGGVVRARYTATIAARILAPVVDVKARPGDRVRRGAALVTLDARQLGAQEAGAVQAALAADESAKAAQAQADAAEANLRLASVTHQRIGDLHGKRAATDQELDQAVAGLRAAEAQLASGRAAAAAAAAARSAARAGADAARVALSYAELTAPFDGVVAVRSVDPGALATPGAPLLTIEDTGAARLEVGLDEARAGLVSVGHQVEIALGGDWTPARVAEIGRLDPAAHSFLVKIDLPPGVTARTGTFGRARFAGRARRTLTVPAASVVRRGQLAFAFVVDRAAVNQPPRADLRPVTTGVQWGDRVEVLAGLSDGEAVVAAPPQALTGGTPLSLGPDGARR